MTPDDPQPTDRLLRQLLSNAMEIRLDVEAGRGEMNARYDVLLGRVDAIVKNLESVIGVDTGSTFDPSVPRDERILDFMVEARREVTLQEITEGSGLSYNSVYSIVISRPDSLLKIGQVMQNSTRKPHTFAINLGFRPVNPKAVYVRKIIERDRGVTPQNPVVQRFAESLMVYTEQVIWARNNGKRLHANRTWKAIENHGLIKAIEIMVDGTETAGFNGLIELGRLDLTAEKIVDDHSEQFDPRIVAKARQRLAEHEEVRRGDGDEPQAA